MASPEGAIVTALVSGAFGVGAAIVTWRLKLTSDDKERALARAKERTAELRSLYAAVFVSFEQAIRQTKAGEQFVVDKDRSEVNAKVQLLASEPVADKFSEAAGRLEEWSRLYALAASPILKIGETRMAVYEWPDPTSKYREPALDAYRALQESLGELVRAMRAEVNSTGGGKSESNSLRFFHWKRLSDYFS